MKEVQGLIDGILIHRPQIHTCFTSESDLSRIQIQIRDKDQNVVAGTEIDHQLIRLLAPGIIGTALLTPLPPR